MVVSSNPSMSNVTRDLECSGGLRVNNQRQKLRQRFDIVRKLGQGTYGKVQLATDKDSGEEVAIKTIKKAKIETEQDLIRIQREIQIMSSVQHPHIIHIYEVFENKEKIVLVMEYACGGELYDYLSCKKSLSESEARRIFRQVVSAVFYCHKNKICHRDLKLENILLDENGNAKIADFGLSNVFDEKRLLDTFCGSPLYASPEIVKGMPYYGPEVDCWSLGVLLYTLVYGAMPFDGSNFRRLVKQISDGDYYEPKKPSDASRLIRRLLTVIPSKRATIEDVCDDWWVNLGYDDCLLALSEEMCKAIPVRLDYVLQLATPALSESSGTADGLTVEEIKSTEKPDTEENLNIQHETSNAMETDASVENKDVEVKKHQLTASQHSLSSVTTPTAKKRQKTNEKENEEKVDDVNEVKDDINESNENNHDGETINADDPRPLIEEQSAPSDMPIIDNEEKTSAISSTTPELDDDRDKLTIVEIVGDIKEEVGESKTELETGNEEVKVEAKPKLKTRSASLKTPDKLNLTAPKDAKDSKKSLVFPALKVSEARRAFETKPPEKRGVVIPGFKVSAARKAFETPSTTNTRRASMPAKISDKQNAQSQPEVINNSQTTTIESPAPSKVTSFMPTLDVTMAIKPKKNAGKPPPVPRMDTSATSGTSSGENTPDDVAKPPPHLKLSTPRRASYPKTTTSVPSNNSSFHDTESRTRTTSESDSLSLNVMTTSSEQSLKSSTSTLTGGDSVDAWGSLASSRDFGTSTSSVVSNQESVKNEERDKTVEVQPQSKPEVAPKVKKVSSMEIKLNSDANQLPKTQMAQPQLVLRQAPGGGKFTLLGVTSEVTFDVAAVQPEEPVENATVELRNPPPPQKNSNLFMSVTLPPPPPPDGDSPSPDIEQEDVPPSSTNPPEEETQEPQEPQETQSRPKQYNRFSSFERETSGGPGERFVREISKDSEESSHQGYSVYRSKFRSLQKAFLGEEATRQREPSVEHSESFSSTGSNDDLEDIFDSLATGDSMLSNILGRTRSIIEEFARDDVAVAARRHSLLKRIPRMSGLRSSDFYSKLDSLRSYADNLSSSASSGIGSSRSSRLSRQPPSDHESSGASSRNTWRSARTQSASTPTRELDPEVESYLNESSARNRWFSRSTSHEEDAESITRSNSSQRRSTFTSSFTRRSISEEDSKMSSNTNVQSDAGNSASQYHSLQRDNLSSSQKRSSLSSRFRSNCGTPTSADSTTSSGWNSGYSRHQSWSEDREVKQDQSQQQYQYSNTLNRNRRTSSTTSEAEQTRRSKGISSSDFANDSSSFLKRDSTSFDGGSSRDVEPTSVYGTMRRPRNISRYGRAATQELPESGYKSQEEDSWSSEGGRPRRPRSLLIMSDSNEDNSEWSRERRAERKESASVTNNQQRRSYARSQYDNMSASTSGSLGNNENNGNEGINSEVKKKSEAEFEFHSGLNQTPRINRFGFRRTPSQERTFESGSACQRETPIRDQVPIWRANSHGREIPPSQGGSTSWSRSRVTDSEKPGLLRRASLNEASKGKLNDDKEKVLASGGAAGYWAKRYGTTSRVPPSSQRRASMSGKVEDVLNSPGEKKNDNEDGFKSFLPRRRSTVGFESDSEIMDEAERTRGLLRYARSISQEMDQLQNDLYARFGMRKMKKNAKTEEEEIKRTTTASSSSSSTTTTATTTTTTTSSSGVEVKSDVGNVVNELQKLEDDLLKFKEVNNLKVKENEKPSESLDDTKSSSKTSDSESKEDKSLSKEEDGSEDGLTTPTDMDDTCSLCSDYERSLAGGSGLDESVSERIRRKSYFARFQDGRRKHHHHLRPEVESLRCRHQLEQQTSDKISKSKIAEENDQSPDVRPTRSASAVREVGGESSTLPKSASKRNHFLTASTNERSISPEYNNINGQPSSPNTKDSPDFPTDNKDDAMMYRHIRAGSVMPEMMEPGGSSGFPSAKSFLRQRSACDPLRPTSPLSRRLTMLDHSPISNGDIHSPHHLPSGWSSFERRKSRPLASIISSLPLEATVQSRAKLRSRHDYLINRALSTLDERYTRPISPTTRRPLAFHDNHAGPPSDLRRFSAILDNASPRDVIRKALDVCNSLQY